METSYKLKLEKASKALYEIFAEDIGVFIERGFNLDEHICQIGQEASRGMLEQVYNEIACRLTREYREHGFQIERNAKVKFKSILGEVEVNSPYLWKAGGSGGVRPMKAKMGVIARGCSDKLKRVLSDFGIEKSFERAAARFAEHYGWDISPTVVMRHTKAVALEAMGYLKEKLAAGLINKEVAVDTMLTELDGCEIRTGIFMRAEEAGQKEKPPDKLVRQEAWREVRTGFVRPLNSITKTYICEMASYPDVCQHLYAAACIRGLKGKTKVISPGDGGHGLQEELSVHFSTLQYILDHRHLESHFYETAEALDVETNARKTWVKNYMDQLWENKVQQVLKQLKKLYKSTNNDRLRRLIGYLTRFEEAVDYGRFRENGWPVGSGEVESAHRYIPQERLKIAGACWHPDTINPMLSLRVIRANNWWNDFWECRQNKNFEIAANG